MITIGGQMVLFVYELSFFCDTLYSMNFTCQSHQKIVYTGFLSAPKNSSATCLNLDSSVYSSIQSLQICFNSLCCVLNAIHSIPACTVIADMLFQRGKITKCFGRNLIFTFKCVPGKKPEL